MGGTGGELKFHLILTLDYELFGNGSGCLDACLRAPVEQCLTIAGGAGATVALFVDAPEFLAFRDQPQYAGSYAGIEAQLVDAVEHGHTLQLHLHPQWLDARYEGGRWSLAMDKWRIGDLDRETIDDLVTDGLDYLRSIAGHDPGHCCAYRAGGWAIQPAAHTLAALAGHGLLMDSTVAPGMHNPALGDWYDFRQAPVLSSWRVDTDVCQVAAAGQGLLTEVPIVTRHIGPLMHARALYENRKLPALPAGCQGSYAGANTRLQTWRSKLSKLAGLGRVMLDFSTMPAEVLIRVTRGWMDQFAEEDGAVPVVAIAHGKNFTRQSAMNLQRWLDWCREQDELGFSDYASWYHQRREEVAS